MSTALSGSACGAPAPIVYINLVTNVASAPFTGPKAVAVAQPILQREAVQKALGDELKKIKAEEKGFDGGILTVIMGFDANGAETGIWVDASTQTKGIGSNVSTDDFLAQFNGMDGTKNIVMNQDFDAYSGATISSTALFAAIPDCINCFNELA